MTNPELIAQALTLPDALTKAETRLWEATRAALRAKERLRDREASLRLDPAKVSGTVAQQDAMIRRQTDVARAELDQAEEAEGRAKIEFRHIERRLETLRAVILGGAK